MYPLFYSPGSCSLVIHALLEELGVPFGLERVDFASRQHQADEYRRIHPKMKVPALVTGEYWSGPRLTAADFHFMVVVRWGRWLDPPATRRKNLEPFYTRMTTRPAVARAFASEGIAPFG